MATPTQSRDKILKEGPIRYRQNAIGLQKWRPRYLVFKVTHAGRLQLYVHKDFPPTAANEIKEIAIDEFGGLEHNLKLENEKYVFAIITTHITECFSTESPQELTAWRQLLQEYLGKELVVNIAVPLKQHLLKAGKAVLRIRNTGFTITTCDNPPRCQGTWHIIHIRKYGGSDMFRFQTGSKCPTGEYLYSIETKDNGGIKNVFNDLSNHRPIFADDRLGRRMTLERKFHTTTSNSSHSQIRTGKNRLSLQAADRHSDRPMYENHEQFQTLQVRHHSSDLGVPYNEVRRASLDDGVLQLESGHGASPNHKPSNLDDDRLYQNIHPSKDSPPHRSSPTKKTYLSPVSVPVPEGYYNLTPPNLVRRQNSSPSSSPEESSLHEQMSLLSPPSGPAGTQNHNAEHGQDLSMAIVGDSLIVNKSKHSRSKTLSPPSEMPEVGGTYQNVELMQPAPAKRNVPENDEVAPVVPATISEEPWSPHNYTNVAFAQATAQGQSLNKKQRRYRMNSPLQNMRAAANSKVERVPVKPSSRDSPVQSTQIQTLVVSTSSDDLLSPSPSLVESKPFLRTSLSNVELNAHNKDKSLDYYNFCAPTLPAHSKSKPLSLRSKQTLSSSQKALHRSSHKSAEILSPNSPDVDMASYSTLSKIMDTVASDSDISSPPYTDFKSKSDSVRREKLKHRSSSWDCLDSREPTAAISNERPDSHNAMYDKLAPRKDTNYTIYDSLAPSKDDILMSGSSSPDASDDPAVEESRNGSKFNFLKRMHTYEYIDVELENHGSEKSGSNSPVGMEHPTDWTSSLPVGFSHREGFRSPTHSFNTTKSLPRRKQLPLQEPSNKPESVCRAKPPRLSRDNSVETPEKRESVLSTSSSSSAELDVKLSTLRQEHTTSSSSHRVTHEDVSLKGRHSESPQDHTDSSEPPPIPKKGIVEAPLSPAWRQSVGDFSPLPKHQEPRFTVPLPQARFDFVKPPPPPKPKVLCPSDLSYAAVTFSNGKGPSAQPAGKTNRPSMKISQTHSDVPYVAVDFEMTAGLQRTSEQVADHHREFLQK